jgi:MoaA/NifB/PqqE/SkfB family radical SAM enzyme
VGDRSKQVVAEVLGDDLLATNVVHTRQAKEEGAQSIMTEHAQTPDTTVHDRTSAHWIMRPGRAPGSAYYYQQRDGRLFDGMPSLADPITSVYTSPRFLGTAPLKVYFDFTNRCNLSCRHCITSSSPHVDTTGELSPERIISLVNEMAQLGVLELATGGGEPLFHPHWTVLLESVTNAGMNLIVTTNGLLLTKEAVGKLKRIGPLEIRVSFDGGPALHEHVRGANTYRRALRGLERLVADQIPAAARLTLCRGAEEELPALFSDLQATGVGKVKIAVVKPAGRAATQTGSHLVGGIPDRDKAAELIRLGEQVGLAVQLSADDFPLSIIDAKDPKLRDVERPNCGAGFESCYITPAGRILGCVVLPGLGFGELQNQSFRTVWEGTLAMKYRQRADGVSTRRLCDGMRGLQTSDGDIVPPAKRVILVEVKQSKNGTMAPHQHEAIG